MCLGDANNDAVWLECVEGLANGGDSLHYFDEVENFNHASKFDATLNVEDFKGSLSEICNTSSAQSEI
jgi:hypothetical protein